MSSQPSSVILAGMSLKPAPFVSTSYDYKTSGQYVIGGFLNVTLDGTLVGTDIVSQMNELGQLQSESNCVSLTVGCQGDASFLTGAGRVTSVQLSPSDQPFIANYSITVSLETVDGSPAVDPDPEFLRRNCLTADQAKFILSYSENIEIEGGDSIGLNDNALGVSKSFIKARGSINVVAFGREVCGIPSFNGLDTAINLLNSRASSLMSFNLCDSANNPLSIFGGWNKWLDSKTLKIDDTGSVEWSFDMYLSKGSCAPYAWVDINIDSNNEFKSGPPEKKRRTISGTIRGLSLSTANLLDNKVNSAERLSNANRALGIVLPSIVNGSWLDNTAVITGTIGTDTSPIGSCDASAGVCYQRISSNISTSVSAGEIKFSAEYADINSCKPNGESIIDVTVEESLPAIRYVEFIVPNISNSIIHNVGDTPHEVTITVRGSLQSCDQNKIQQTITCVDQEFDKASRPYRSWLVKSENKSISTYSYSRTKSLIKCDG